MGDDQIYAPAVDYSNEPEKKTSVGGHIVDFIQTFVVFGAIFAIIYLFVAQPHKVSGSSMLPNFQDGNYILTDKVSYRLGDPQKGDVIVLKNPRNESQDFIKRIVALPGNTVKVSAGHVFVNGTQISENYLPAGVSTVGRSFLPEGEEITLGSDQYFVLGDNRDHSSDSREIGPIARQLIIGKVFIRYWPPQVFGLIKHSP